MQIDLKPEDVDELVKQTILKAGIGKTIQDVVAKTLGSSYDNPIEKAMKSYITTVVMDLLKTDFKDKVDAAVRAALEAKLTSAVAERLADETINKIVKAATDRDY